MAYATRSDIESRFGKSSVLKWASMEGTTSRADVVAAITTALADAETEVNDMLRGGPYAIPFASVPSRITKETARLAGVLLYEARGVELEDESDDAETIGNHRKHVMNTLRNIKHGNIQLDVSVAYEMHPQVIVES